MTNAIVERARALVGCRFRRQGRDPRLGLDCVGLIVTTFDVPTDEVPHDYRLRACGDDRLKRELERHFRRVRPSTARSGDVLLFTVATSRPHLAVLTDRGFVHADARARRVVETPGAAPWAIDSVYRRRMRRRQGE